LPHPQLLIFSDMSAPEVVSGEASCEWATGSLADVDAENGIHPEVTVSGWWFGT
jgi:hypothetical protein